MYKNYKFLQKRNRTSSEQKMILAYFSSSYPCLTGQQCLPDPMLHRWDPEHPSNNSLMMLRWQADFNLTTAIRLLQHVQHTNTWVGTVENKNTYSPWYRFYQARKFCR